MQEMPSSLWSLQEDKTLEQRDWKPVAVDGWVCHEVWLWMA